MFKFISSFFTSIDRCANVQVDYENYTVASVEVVENKNVDVVENNTQVEISENNAVVEENIKKDMVNLRGFFAINSNNIQAKLAEFMELFKTFTQKYEACKILDYIKCNFHALIDKNGPAVSTDYLLSYMLINLNMDGRVSTGNFIINEIINNVKFDIRNIAYIHNLSRGFPRADDTIVGNGFGHILRRVFQAWFQRDPNVVISDIDFFQKNYPNHLSKYSHFDLIKKTHILPLTNLHSVVYLYAKVISRVNLKFHSNEFNKSPFVYCVAQYFKNDERKKPLYDSFIKRIIEELNTTKHFNIDVFIKNYHLQFNDINKHRFELTQFEYNSLKIVYHYILSTYTNFYDDFLPPSTHDAITLEISNFNQIINDSSNTFAPYNDHNHMIQFLSKHYNMLL
jgi:hypothetical protein